MRTKKGFWPICLGLLLIAAALLLTVRNMRDENRARQSAEQIMERLREYIPDGESSGQTDPSEKSAFLSENEMEIPDYILNPHMEMPVQNIDGVDYIGKLNIPAYDLELPVISRWDYPSLKIAPCRYQGSAYTDDLIIAAHNFQSHFGNLKNLSQGDAVIFTDMDGNVFTYEVAVCEILEPTAIKEMESGGWDLTLFTCTIGGQSRVTVRCQRK